jgi:chaperonin GroES
VAIDPFGTFDDAPYSRKRVLANLTQHGNKEVNLLRPVFGPNRLFRRRLEMNLRPLHDRILIKRIEEKEAVKGGIIIPDTAKEKPQKGEVIAVGNGKKNEDGNLIPLDVKAGDRILFGKYSGAEIKMDGQEFLILREEEVLGIIEGKAATVSGKK